MEKQERRIKALGEIVLRVKSMEVMQDFYENVMGLKLLKRFDDITFFEIAPSYGGHTQVLGLFKESMPPDHGVRHFTGLDAEKTTLHHLAFVIASADYESEKERLEKLGLAIETQKHGWVHWRSLYVVDPEDNLVELVCYDQNME